MVDINTIVLKLISKQDATIDRIIEIATNEYFELLRNIAADIYDSCIASFYASYTPRVYTRHGDISGSNLYLANQMSYEDGYLSFYTEETMLEKYGGSTDKREEVLDAVMSGVRGGPIRPGWPKSWKRFCKYPNNFSEYGEYWQGTRNTIDGILEEFSQNGFGDTYQYFWEIVAKYI